MTGTAAILKRATCFWCGKPGHILHQCNKRIPQDATPRPQAGTEAPATGRLRGVEGTHDGALRAPVSQEPEWRGKQRSEALEASLVVATERFSDALERHGNILREQ